MDSMAEIFLERANNEVLVAESLKKITEKHSLKQELELPPEITFYSAVISHSYYAIFYAAKAILLTKGIKTSSPDIHKRTLYAFKETFVDTGLLDVKLLEIYQKMVMRADTLLEIFKDEKWKRGNFTYETIPQANKEPAEDSLKNSKLFVSNISKVMQKTKTPNKKDV